MSLMFNQIKKKKNIFLIFFIFLFFPLESFSDYESKHQTLEGGAREKFLGLERKDIDSPVISQQRFITDIKLGNIETIKMFLKKKNNKINFVTQEGYHPLVYAARVNHMEAVKLFLTSTEVDVNSQNRFGNTALIGAAEIGNVEMVEYLINNGADIEHQNNEGQTAAMKAVKGNRYYVLKIFLDQNIDLNLSDYSGRTIKDMAKQSRDKRILKMLN